MAVLKLSFDTPRHGWLPVRLEVGSHILEFAASDILNDPVDELCTSLVAAAKGYESMVRWFLEPDGYYFRFAPKPNGVELQVLFAPGDRGNNRSEVITVTGSKEEILLPIWRALRRLETLEIVRPHWGPIEQGSIPDIKRMLRNEE